MYPFAHRPTQPPTIFTFEPDPEQLAIGDARPLFLAELAKTEDIPLLPRVAREVVQLLGDPEAPQGRIVHLLVQDAALSAQLLKLANSARYGGGHRSATIADALMRVGRRGTHEILLLASASRVLVVRNRPELTERLRYRANAVAVASSLVARSYGTASDAAFTAGLLHEVGVAIFWGLVPRLVNRLPSLLGGPPAGVDRLGHALHEGLGAAQATRWGLPPEIVAAIGHHHEPELATAGALMAHVVAAAVRIVDRLPDEAFDVDQALSTEPVFRRLQLASPKIASIRSTARTQVQDLHL